MPRRADYQDFFGLVELNPVHPACQGEACGEAWLILSEDGKIITLVAVWIYLLILSVKLNRRSEI